MTSRLKLAISVLQGKLTYILRERRPLLFMFSLYKMHTGTGFFVLLNTFHVIDNRHKLANIVFCFIF